MIMELQIMQIEYADFRDFIKKIATADAAIAGLKIN